MPVGKYDKSERSVSPQSINTFQLGTGSVDFLLNAAYDLRVQDNGVNINASYKINTANEDEYQYGNKITMNAQYYHKFRVHEKISVSPNIGATYENAMLDRDDGYKLDVSGGRVVMGSLGVEVLVAKRLALGGNYQVPLSQDLAAGFARAGNRCMAHIAYLF